MTYPGQHHKCTQTSASCSARWHWSGHPGALGEAGEQTGWTFQQGSLVLWSRRGEPRRKTWACWLSSSHKIQRWHRRPWRTASRLEEERERMWGQKDKEVSQGSHQNEPFPWDKLSVLGNSPWGLWVGQCNLWRTELVAMGCSTLHLHRPASPLIGRSDMEQWIQNPQGSAEDFAAPGIKCVIWTREPLSRKAHWLSKSCLLGVVAAWPVELCYYEGERLQLQLVIVVPDAFKEQKESICMTAQSFAAKDSRKQGGNHEFVPRSCDNAEKASRQRFT